MGIIEVVKGMYINIYVIMEEKMQTTLWGLGLFRASEFRWEYEGITMWGGWRGAQ